LLINRFDFIGADGQVQRVMDAFALAMTTGWLASVDNFGVLTHNVAGVEESICYVFERWLSDHGGKNRDEGQEIVDHITDFLMQHEARFETRIASDTGDINGSRGAAPRDCLGYTGHCGGKTFYYIIPERFREEMCRGYNERGVKKALEKAGMLKGDAGKYVKTVWGNGGSRKMIVLELTNTCVPDNP
jgi:uncharacterized protein (DUF927 family)